jgi:hypothetical protein
VTTSDILIGVLREAAPEIAPVIYSASYNVSCSRQNGGVAETPRLKILIGVLALIVALAAHIKSTAVVGDVTLATLRTDVPVTAHFNYAIGGDFEPP